MSLDSIRSCPSARPVGWLALSEIQTHDSRSYVHWGSVTDIGTILILGAGPTGLGAAYRLQQLEFANWHLLEAADHPGGLASSFTDDHGFTWDVGGHVQFSHYEQYDRMVSEVLEREQIWHERRALVWINGDLVPYPLQLNLHRLRPDDRDRALAGLEAAAHARATSTAGAPPNFRSWIDRTFGVGLAELFMVPYNEKVWGYPLEALGWGWIGERVAAPDLAEVRLSVASGTDSVAWGPNRRFSYPRHGGTGAIWKKLAASLSGSRLEFSVGVVGVNLAGRIVLLSDGRTLPWNTLVSSLPLDVLCRLCIDIEPAIQHAARQLVYSSCHVVGVGLRGDLPRTLAGVSWIYFAGAESPYYRVTVLSNYSPHNAPPGCWSLMAEVSETAYRPLGGADVSASVTSALRQDGLIPTDVEIVSIWKHCAERAYPTPFLGRDDVLGRILPSLEKRRVYSRGRFGAWKYEVSNQDHSFMQGVEVIDRLLGHGEEMTVSFPDVVNRRT